MSEFEELMRLGVESHVSRDYDSALEFRLKADQVATNLLEHGRARRDVAATYQRRGDYDSALIWIDKSLSSLEEAVENSLDNAKRERGATRDWLARVILAGAVELEIDTGTRLGESYEQAKELYDTIFKEDLPEDDFPNIDQYKINMLGAASIALSLSGDKKRGRGLAWRTIRAGLWSESPRLETSADHLSVRERSRRKLKVVAKGAGSLVVAFLNKKRRREVLLIAQRVI